MKLIGNLTDSLIIKLTLLFFELFWIPIISIRNKERLKVRLTIPFFIGWNMKNIFIKSLINIINNAF